MPGPSHQALLHRAGPQSGCQAGGLCPQRTVLQRHCGRRGSEVGCKPSTLTRSCSCFSFPPLVMSAVAQCLLCACVFVHCSRSVPRPRSPSMPPSWPCSHPCWGPSGRTTVRGPSSPGPTSSTSLRTIHGYHLLCPHAPCMPCGALTVPSLSTWSCALFVVQRTARRCCLCQ